jgi:hypothetical protein
MNEDRTERDWLLLSAWLDGELGEAERNNLERRLAEDADLREVLEGLSQTRAALRNLKPKRTPRNFTITPDTAGAAARPQVGWFSPLRLASSMAALVMLFALAAGMASLGTSKTAAPVAERQAFDQAAMGEAEATIPPSLIYWGQAAPVPQAYAIEGRGGMGGGGGGVSEPPVIMESVPLTASGNEAPKAPVAEADAALQAEIPASQPAEELSTPTPVSEVPQTLPQPKATLPALQKALPEATPTGELLPLEGTGPILGIAPPGEGVTPAEPANRSPQATTQNAAHLPGWFLAAVIAALAAAALWLADMILRRRRA